MKTPVLIAARGEAENIARALDALPRSAEPIVIPNGPDDGTADIAARYGARVLRGSREGKLPALQLGLECLGARALEPVVTLDADARPLMPNRWLPALLKARENLDAHSPAVINGEVVYSRIDPVTALWRNAGHWRQLVKNRNGDPGGANGNNMLFHLKDEQTLQAVLDMPHYWPREDTAMKDVVVARGGTFARTLDPRAIVATSGDRFPGLIARVRYGREAGGQMVRQSYLEDAAPGSIPYWDTEIAEIFGRDKDASTGATGR